MSDHHSAANPESPGDARTRAAVSITEFAHEQVVHETQHFADPFSTLGAPS